MTITSDQSSSHKSPPSSTTLPTPSISHEPVLKYSKNKNNNSSLIESLQLSLKHQNARILELDDSLNSLQVKNKELVEEIEKLKNTQSKRVISIDSSSQTPVMTSLCNQYTQTFDNVELISHLIVQDIVFRVMSTRVLSDEFSNVLSKCLTNALCMEDTTNLSQEQPTTTTVEHYQLSRKNTSIVKWANRIKKRLKKKD